MRFTTLGIESVVFLIPSWAGLYSAQGLGPEQPPPTRVCSREVSVSTKEAYGDGRVLCILFVPGKHLYTATSVSVVKPQ